MNKKKRILVVSAKKDTGLSAWMEANQAYDLRQANTDEQAIELCHSRAFDLVVTDKTDETVDHRKLQVILPILDENLRLIHYEGEEPSDMEDKLKKAFEQIKKERIQKIMVLDSSPSGLGSFSAN